MAGFKSVVHIVGAKWSYEQTNTILITFTLTDPKDNLLTATGRDF
jgi:hypothetical protein